MTRAAITGAAVTTAVVLVLVLGLLIRNVNLAQDGQSDAATSPGIGPSTPAAADAHTGFLYGRITTVDGATHEGRLRWGGDQEAFWGDYFNGAKNENPWAAYLPREPSPFELFGFEIGGKSRSSELRRLFMARFGDVARIAAHFKYVQVILKSGTVFTLDRFAAGDIDDGVRVWDSRRGVVDLDARRIRTIEFLPTARLAAAPERLHGTVRTGLGNFVGFIQWTQQDGVSTDTLDGRTADREISLRYETIRSIARLSRDRALVTLVDGREIVLSGSHELGTDHRGIYVDDRRYGRVLIPWDAFDRVDFSSGGGGPAYGDFLPGRSLAGRVTTRDGRRLAGRLVYDFDESETTETFDAPFQRVDYNIPFDLITSIVPAGRNKDGIQRAKVILHGGEELQLDRDGDFGERNAGVLIFVDGRGRPEIVPWTDVERIDLDRAPGVR